MDNITPSNSAAQALEEELNLSQLLGSLQRRWLVLVIGAFSGLIIAGVNTSKTQRIWQGEFQIVVAEDVSASGNSGNLANLLGSLSGLAGAGGAGKELQTQVKILESPLVLRPAFEQIQKLKHARGENRKNVDFLGWANSRLDVKIEKGTSILIVTYRDTDKNIVLPALLRISTAYQEYSGRERRESLRNGRAFLQNQLADFKAQAIASDRELDAYEFRYGISESSGSSFGNIEIGDTGSNLSSLLGLGSSDSLGLSDLFSAPSVNSAIGNSNSPTSQLSSINQELIRLRETFTDRDPRIKILLRERATLLKFVESTANGKLGVTGNKPPSKEQAQQIVLQHRELQRNAKRNNSTLNSLENSFRSLQLQQARATKPWELISTPTLLDQPVSPRPARNLALGLLVGLVVGSGAALLWDRRSDLVFTSEELEAEIPLQLLDELHPSNTPASLQLLAQGPLAQASGVGLIPLGLEAQDPQLQALLEQLRQCLPQARVELGFDCLAVAGCSHQLLLTRCGTLRRAQLKQLRRQLQLLPRPLTGWLLLTSADV